MELEVRGFNGDGDIIEALPEALKKGSQQEIMVEM